MLSGLDQPGLVADIAPEFGHQFLEALIAKGPAVPPGCQFTHANFFAISAAVWNGKSLSSPNM